MHSLQPIVAVVIQQIYHLLYVCIPNEIWTSNKQLQ